MRQRAGSERSEAGPRNIGPRAARRGCGRARSPAPRQAGRAGPSAACPRRYRGWSAPRARTARRPPSSRAGTGSPPAERSPPRRPSSARAAHRLTPPRFGGIEAEATARSPSRSMVTERAEIALTVQSQTVSPSTAQTGSPPATGPAAPWRARRRCRRRAARARRRSGSGPRRPRLRPPRRLGRRRRLPGPAIRGEQRARDHLVAIEARTDRGAFAPSASAAARPRRPARAGPGAIGGAISTGSATSRTSARGEHQVDGRDGEDAGRARSIGWLPRHQPLRLPARSAPSNCDLQQQLLRPVARRVGGRRVGVDPRAGGSSGRARRSLSRRSSRRSRRWGRRGWRAAPRSGRRRARRSGCCRRRSPRRRLRWRSRSAGSGTPPAPAPRCAAAGIPGPSPPAGRPGRPGAAPSGIGGEHHLQPAEVAAPLRGERLGAGARLA